MKNVRILLKNYLKCRFTLTQSFHDAKLSERSGGKRVMSGIGKTILIIISLVYMAFVYGGMMYGFFDVAKMYNQPQALLTVAVVAASIMILLFGGFTVMSELYYSKDREILLSMPIKPSEMTAFKFISVYIWEELIAAVIMLPAIGIYGVRTAQGVGFYLAGIASMLLVPVIPLAIAAFVVIIIMRFTTARRQNDKMSTIFGLVFFVVIMLGTYYVTGQFASGGNEFVYKMLISEEGLVGVLSANWLPSIWTTKIMTAGLTEALLNLLILIAVSAGAAALMIFTAKKIYIKGMLNAGSVGEAKKLPKSAGGASVAYRAASPVKAVFVREWREILRTPVYAMNSLISVVMGPIIVFMPMLMNAGKAAGEGEELYELAAKQINAGNGPLVMIAFFALFLFLGAMNMAGATMISREGTMFFVTKSYPQNYDTMIMGKFWCAYTISAMSSVTTGIAALIAFRIPVLYIAIAIVMSLVAFLPLTAIELLSDIRKPKLKWENPTVAIKQNINGMIGMGLCMLAATVMGVLVFLCFRYTELPLAVTCIAVPLACSVMMAVPLIKLMKKAALSKLSRIE